MKNQDLVDYLRKCSVCETCQLRHLKARGSDYVNPKKTFENAKVKCEDISVVECGNKRQRLDDDRTCPVCLGLFSQNFQQQIMEHILATDIKKYDCDQIVVALSLPMLLQIRQLGMWFALQRKFGDEIDSKRTPDVPLKEAIKLILNPNICDQLKKTYDVNGLTINISLQHDLEKKEVASLEQLNAALFPLKRGKRQEISRGVLEKLYTPSTIKASLYEKYMPIPPSVPAEILRIDSISLTGPTVCVAGRYRKISRHLSHTPWVLYGKRVMEDSIEEIIMRNVTPYFCADSKKVIFMSSGREDVDVRCLGKGRPFVLEIPNSHRSQLSVENANRMEQQIEKSLKVSVRNLQIVQRDELTHIKKGEEDKRKYYRALCKLNDPATTELLEKLNLPEGFEIQQKTPIRVLHRRPLHTRPRTIYSVKAYVQRGSPHVLVLDIVSQAGTYIKELVHGEFGRTTPSITSIIGQHIDILALDVVGIDLQWPKEVDNSI